MEGGFGSGGEGPGFFSAANKEHLEHSFSAFTRRPENRALVEAAQADELRDVVEARDRAAAAAFIAKVEASSDAVRQALLPFLRSDALLRLAMTLANDPQQGFETWATNPRVLQLFKAAHRALRERRISEVQLLQHMMAYLKDPSNTDGQAYRDASKLRVVLPAHQLVEPLNEHLTERRAGSTAYRAGQYSEALDCYRRALAVLQLVDGATQDDKQLVRDNMVTTLLNLAAAHMALQEPGAAVRACSEVLALVPDHTQALARRAKAHMALQHLQEAEADIASLAALLHPAGAGHVAGHTSRTSSHSGTSSSGGDELGGGGRGGEGLHGGQEADAEQHGGFDEYSDELRGLMKQLRAMKLQADRQARRTYARMFAAPGRNGGSGNTGSSSPVKRAGTTNAEVANSTGEST